MIRSSILLVLIISLLPFDASCGEVAGRTMAKQELSDLLQGVRPWPEGSTNYSVAAWNALISAARVLQVCDPNSVSNALQEYQAQFDKAGFIGTGSNKLDFIDADSKLLLLMRVVFELPERGPAAESRVGFGGWISRSADGGANWRRNLAWPISWTQAGPRLVATFGGLEGPRYDAAVEYSYFRTNYPTRGLKGKLPPLKSGKSTEPPPRSLVSIDVPGVVVVNTQPAKGGGIVLHVREVAGETTTLDVGNVKTWVDIEEAAEVNALGDPIQEGIESIALKPYDVRFIRLRFGSPGS